MPDEADLLEEYRDGFRTADELAEWAIRAYRVIARNQP